MEYIIVRSIYSSRYAKLMDKDESLFNMCARREGYGYRISANPNFENGFMVTHDYMLRYFRPVSGVNNNIFKLCPSTLGGDKFAG